MNDEDRAEKTYIGDAIYARINQYGELILTTEDGIRHTNTIVIGAREWAALLAYVENSE